MWLNNFSRAQSAWENQTPGDDLEVENQDLRERESELVTALDNIADLLKDVTATQFTDLHRDQILEWADVR